MFWVEIRPILFICFALGLAYLFYRVGKKILRTSGRDELLDRKEALKEEILEANVVDEKEKEKSVQASKKIRKYLK